MSDAPLLSILSNGVLTLTLNRPDKMNAFTPAMNGLIADAFDAASENDEVRVIVLTGAGRAFCAGADITNGAQSFDATMFGGDSGPRAAGRFIESIFNCKKPSIAAINGAAVGVGLTMALPCDFRIVADEAKLGFVFTRRGLAPEAGCAWFLPRLVGMAQALKWCIGGQLFSAAEARAAGLATETAPASDVLDRALALAADIAANTSPVAVAVTRQLLWRFSGDETPERLLGIDGQLNAELGMGADVMEGVSAFMEKRSADFPGRASRDMPAAYPWWTPYEG
ncbi:crotonase/enoyl-CoA hydratase family protein [soil metagenome]